MHRIARSLIPSAALVLIAIPAVAQTQYRFEVYGAAMFPRHKDAEINAPQSTVPRTLTYASSVGARGGIRLGADQRKGRWGQDFIYSYGTNATRIINYLPGKRFAFTSRSHQFSYNALWCPGGLHTKRASVFPYLTAGVGGTFFNLSKNAINEALDPQRGALGKLRNQNVLAVNAGGGVRVRINGIYGFRYDIRDYMTRVPRHGLPKTSADPNAIVLPTGGIFHQLEVSFAFVYYF